MTNTRSSCRTLSPTPPTTRHVTARGYILAEALLSIAIVAMAALPLAVLGTTELDTLGRQRSVFELTRIAAEAVEAGPVPLWPLDSSRPAAERCDAAPASASVPCAPGIRLLIAGAEPLRVALWMAP